MKPIQKSKVLKATANVRGTYELWGSLGLAKERFVLLEKSKSKTGIFQIVPKWQAYRRFQVRFIANKKTSKQIVDSWVKLTKKEEGKK